MHATHRYIENWTVVIEYNVGSLFVVHHERKYCASMVLFSMILFSMILFSMILFSMMCLLLFTVKQNTNYYAATVCRT